MMQEKKMRLISDSGYYVDHLYRRVFRDKQGNRETSFECDKSGAIDRDRLSLDELKRLDEMMVQSALNKVEDLGVSSREIFVKNPPIGACINCGFYIKWQYVNRCSGCDFVYDQEGVYDENLTEYFRNSKKLRKSSRKLDKLDK